MPSLSKIAFIGSSKWIMVLLKRFTEFRREDTERHRGDLEDKAVNTAGFEEQYVEIKEEACFTLDKLHV